MRIKKSKLAIILGALFVNKALSIKFIDGGPGQFDEVYTDWVHPFPQQELQPNYRHHHPQYVREHYPTSQEVPVQYYDPIPNMVYPTPHDHFETAPGPPVRVVTKVVEKPVVQEVVVEKPVEKEVEEKPEPEKKVVEKVVTKPKEIDHKAVIKRLDILKEKVKEEGKSAERAITVKPEPPEVVVPEPEPEYETVTCHCPCTNCGCECP